MWYLVEILGLSVLWATVVCFFSINAIGHHFSRQWTFKARSPKYLRSFIRFFVVMTISLGLNIGLMYFLVIYIGWPYLFASAIIALFFFIGNFVAHRDWTYAR